MEREKIEKGPSRKLVLSRPNKFIENCSEVHVQILETLLTNQNFNKTLGEIAELLNYSRSTITHYLSGNPNSESEYHTKGLYGVTEEITGERPTSAAAMVGLLILHGVVEVEDN